MAEQRLAERVRWTRAILALALRAPSPKRSGVQNRSRDFETRAILALALRAPSPKRSGVQNRSRDFVELAWVRPRTLHLLEK